MKRKSIIIALALTLIFSFFNTKPIFASEQIDENDLVSLEEFVLVMKNTYEKYGVELKLVDSSNYNPITREELVSLIESIEEEEKAIMEANLEAKTTYKKLLEKNKNTSSTKEPSRMPPMEVTLNFADTHTVTGKDSSIKNAYVVIAFSSKTKYDTHREDFISITPGRTYDSDSLNLKEIEFVNDDWNIINGGSSLNFYVDGLDTFEWTEPHTGNKFTSKRPFNFMKFFTPEDAL